jgi:hypothetical protein
MGSKPGRAAKLEQLKTWAVIGRGKLLQDSGKATKGRNSIAKAHQRGRLCRAIARRPAPAGPKPGGKPLSRGVADAGAASI